MECIADYATGETVAGNGKFILGQEQDSYGIETLFLLQLNNL